MATVKEDQLFRVETIDWTGGQIKDDDSSEDVKRVDLTQVHYLSVCAIVLSLLYVAFFWHVLGPALASFLLSCCRILIPADLTQGPIRCEDSAGVPAMPGDLLVVELCEVSVCVHVFGLRLCVSKSHTIYLDNPDVVYFLHSVGI